jgi:hypothetical protein
MERLEDIKKQIDTLRKEQFRLEELDRKKNHYPKLNKLIGTCYKFRNSSGSDRRWWLYCKITGHNGKGVMTVLKIQKDIYANIQIETNTLWMEYRVNLDGYIKIPPKTFENQFKRLTSELIKRKESK